LSGGPVVGDGDGDSDMEEEAAPASVPTAPANAHRKSNDKYARRMPSHCERSYKHLYRLLEAHGRSMDSLASQTRKLVQQSLAKAGEGQKAYDKVYLTDVNVLEILDSQIDAVLGSGASDTTATALSTDTDGGMLTNAEAARLELRTLLTALGLIEAVTANSEIQDTFALKAEFPPYERDLTTVLFGTGTEQLKGAGYAGSMAASDGRSQDDAYLREKYPADYFKKRYMDSNKGANPNYVDDKKNYEKGTFWHQVFSQWYTLRRKRKELIPEGKDVEQWRGHDGADAPLGDFETWVRATYPWANRDTPKVTEESLRQSSEEVAGQMREYLDAMRAHAGSQAGAAAMKTRHDAVDAELRRLATTHLPGGVGEAPSSAEGGGRTRKRAKQPSAEDAFRAKAAAQGLEGDLSV